MKAVDEITIKLRAEESNGGCYGCFYDHVCGSALLLTQYHHKDIPCNGKNIIFKQIEKPRKKSR